MDEDGSFSMQVEELEKASMMRLPRNIFEYGRRIRSLRHALRDDVEQDQGCVQSDALSSVLQRDSDTNSSNFSNNLDYEAVNFQLMEGDQGEYGRVSLITWMQMMNQVIYKSKLIFQ